MVKGLDFKDVYIIAMLFVMIGSTMNFQAVVHNEGKMPVYTNDESVKYLVDKNKFHSWFDSKEDVKRFYFTDIINIKWAIISLGDVFMFVGLSIQTITLIALIKKNRRIKNENKNQQQI